MVLRRSKGAKMSILDTITKPEDRPIAITIIGDAGLGKTSLAATFPKPIFIRSEDGLQAVPAASRPDAFPVLRSAEDLWPQLAALVKEDHAYQTCVIDTVTTLDALFTDWVMETDPKGAKSLNQAHGGFGAGRDMVASQHRRVRKACGMMMEKGMNVVFIGHADTETMDLPDMDAFGRYTVRLHKKAMPHYTDNVDLVGFVRLKTFTRGDGDKKRAISNGEREIICFPQASSVTKNRFGITQAIPFTVDGGNPFEKFAAK
jgi:GTPase SAR1 family protein